METLSPLTAAWMELFNDGRGWRNMRDPMRDLRWSILNGLITKEEAQIINQEIWKNTNVGVVRF